MSYYLKGFGQSLGFVTLFLLANAFAWGALVGAVYIATYQWDAWIAAGSALGLVLAFLTAHVLGGLMSVSLYGRLPR